jgi:hypothetical protein
MDDSMNICGNLFTLVFSERDITLIRMPKDKASNDMMQDLLALIDIFRNGSKTCHHAHRDEQNHQDEQNLKKEQTA